MPETTDANQHRIDPDDPPDHVDELYVASSSHSGGCYHVDPECRSLRSTPKARRVEIAASWYDPCTWCVPKEVQ